MMHEESKMNQEAFKLGNGRNSNFVASEDSPQHAVRDPHHPVLQSAGTPGDCKVLAKLCHTLG